jgi:hypothetical protein
MPKIERMANVYAALEWLYIASTNMAAEDALAVSQYLLAEHDRLAAEHLKRLRH